MVNSHPAVIAGAREALAPLADSDRRRILVGITGPPAAGKSTLAATLAEALRSAYGSGAAVAVPMDGFHLANAELHRLGLANRKGAPETFDVAGFVNLLRRLREPDEREVVYAPEFNRALNEPVGSAIPVPLDELHRIFPADLHPVHVDAQLHDRRIGQLRQPVNPLHAVERLERKDLQMDLGQPKGVSRGKQVDKGRPCDARSA